jgi:hypothetical protein
MDRLFDFGKSKNGGIGIVVAGHFLVFEGDPLAERTSVAVKLDDHQRIYRCVVNVVAKGLE